jgi:hypothetical protein
VYSRDYAGKTLDFEASGGLMQSSLVMQDKQTDTYWSIMTGGAVGGSLEGTDLIELPVSKKAQWKDWLAEHPDTLVLSVGGVEDVERNVYEQYFADSRGFRGQSAEDGRLSTKTQIYAFRYDEVPFAVEAETIVGGRVFDLPGGRKALFYRAPGAEILASSVAFISRAGFEKRDGVWTETGTGSSFSPGRLAFDSDTVERLSGFDTFWYNWSLIHPDTEILND